MTGISTLVFVSLLLGTAAEEPTFEGIDYASPQSYLDIPASLGDRERITEQAQALKGRNERATIRKVLEWIEANLTCDGDKAYAWRNYDDVVRERCYGGCADQAIVCGALLRAAGLPTVWVKTMDVAWIWDFKQGRPFEAWSGHVFLEVYVDGKWLLLDAGAKLLYTNYSPQSRILPGNRFAYHKGSDPQRMIMSLEWEAWKEQTRAYFSQLDPNLLPVDAAGGQSVVPQVYVIGNSPYYNVLSEMARGKGWLVKMSFNTDYDKHLPLARGHVLLVETHRGVPIVKQEVLEKHLPGAYAGLKSPSGTFEIDGTTVMFVDFAKMLSLDEEPESAKGK